MHELTIASSLIDLASDHAARNGRARVTGMHVRLGVMCGIARSLYFCFGPATRGTLCEGAKLHIEEVPLTIFCEHCAEARSPLSLSNLRCTDCGRPSRKVLSGREMELTHIELEEEAPHPALAPIGQTLQ
ncbi:Hydrogenase/urease nickel incorporation protein HypA [Aminobacter sp. MSH1]|uniref:hydrogenase maturation nickel metallochaperone HypA/HybF n=1 Tax=Aminobacter sp. MSH1 TaxID=374606 RepID=UPI000D352037|nr:hydrogenase maturation nickel metallochaperone HypA [Aminobacter sp. MSH1]AWC25031.1 Hydrogenase/urease nickel incorporation protein HypA [Aminobacter sp. MSH1]